MRRHEAALRALLRRLAGDQSDDLAQETFIIAWRRAETWQQTGSYRSWLLRIAWRQFLSTRRRQRPTESLDHAAVIAVEPTARRKAAIDEAMGRLGERERMAALLCFAEGCTHPEAARIMNVPLGTLKSLVARARRGLVECLEDAG